MSPPTSGVVYCAIGCDPSPTGVFAGTLKVVQLTNSKKHKANGLAIGRTIVQLTENNCRKINSQPQVQLH